VTGYGTGIDDRCLENKINVIKKAISVNKPDAADGIDVLSKVGGFEIGGIAGIILGCASGRTPVVIDGFISGAGALIAASISPDSTNYMIASHCSAEKGHRIVLNRLGLKPLFDFDMRLGEGTGAAIGINIMEASVKILSEMATFSQAGVSEKKE
jgi:nicotinate-nucleotide--dimethylbenzimidazole phosphoribosyltransferase